MNPPQDEETIFDAALRLPTAERAAFVVHATGADVDLRRRIEALLANYDGAGFLEQAVAPPLRSTPVPFASITEKPGDTIGRYKLLQQIGEGGCGIVYMAEQTEPVRRRVALKIIRLGMDTRSVIARFEAERQALALMDHPNIAKVLDAGSTETGRPYFVMELVRGMKITEYCDEKKLSTRERLDLFIQVCHAIQHAHQKGIIHRDIKPSNILVSTIDGAAVPKVIDFGIAKATGGQTLTDKTIFTAFEQFIGTPAYMSPEQALISNVDVDTRTDIYALGVLLYELLTGKTPFDTQQLLVIGLDEMRRTIREQEPPRPSTRLSALPGQELSTTAQRRGLEGPKLVSQLRGDLDWVVMKALEKDRSRRYPTTVGLAADIRRYLHNEPVLASPPSAIYRLRKAIRRNKLAFAAASAVVVALLLGATLATISLFHAAEQAALAQAVNNFLQTDLLRQASSYAQAEAHFIPDPNLTVREALQRATERVNVRFKGRPLQEAAVRVAIGEAMIGVGEWERAVTQFQRAVDLRRTMLGPTHSDTLTAMNHLGNAYRLAGKLAQAIPLFEQTLKLRKHVLGPKHPDTLTSMYYLASVYYFTRPEEARLLAEGCLRLQRVKLGPENPDTLRSMGHLGRIYTKLGKHSEAIALLKKTLELQKRALGLDDPQTLISMGQLAGAYFYGGKLEESIALFEETLRRREAALGPDHPMTLQSISSLATAYRSVGRANESLSLFEKALTLKREKLSADHPETLQAMLSLAGAYHAAGRDDEAARLLEERLKVLKAKPEPEDSEIWTTMHNLALAYLAGGKPDNVVRVREEMLAIARSGHPLEDPLTLNAMEDLGNACVAAGKLDRAQSVFREALQPHFTTFGTNNPKTLAALENLARTDRTAGKLDEALTLFRQILETKKALPGTDAESLLDAIDNVAWTLTMLRRYSEAEKYYREAVTRIKSDAVRREMPLHAVVLHRLADVLHRQQLRTKARPFAQDAVDLYRRHPEWPLGERRHAIDVLMAILKDLHDSTALKAVAPLKIEALRAAIETQDRSACNELAWMLATSTDPALRDGAAAVRFAEKALTARKDWATLDTLAAAYAEAGEYAKATTTQLEALSLAQDEQVKKDLEARLKLYQAGSPFRE